METWKAIPGYEGIYEISNQGRVRSLDRVAKNGVRSCKACSRTRNRIRQGRISPENMQEASDLEYERIIKEGVLTF